MAGPFKNSLGSAIDVVVPESAIPGELARGEREALRQSLILYAHLCHVQNHIHEQSDLEEARQFCNRRFGKGWKSYRMLSDTISKLKSKIKAKGGDPSFVEPPRPTTPSDVVVATSAPRGRFSIRNGRPLSGRSSTQTSTAAAHQSQPKSQPSPAGSPLAPVVPGEPKLDADDRLLLLAIQADLAKQHDLQPQPRTPSPGVCFPLPFTGMDKSKSINHLLLRQMKILEDHEDDNTLDYTTQQRHDKSKSI